MNVGGGRECSLSLLETTEICRRLTGNEIPIEPVAETQAGRRSRIPFRLRETLRPGRVATAPQRRAVLADIHEWIASDPSESPTH